MLLANLLSHRTISVFTGLVLCLADEQFAFYFLLVAAVLKIGPRFTCPMLACAYVANDIVSFLLLASLLTFLICVPLASTFAMIYLLFSGMQIALLVIFKNVITLLQINFCVTLCFAAAQYIFVTVFSPSGTIGLLVQLPIKLLMLVQIFLHTLAAFPTSLALLFFVLATSTTSMRIAFLLGSVAQSPSLLNLFVDIPDAAAVNFIWYAAMLISIFIILESGLTVFLGYIVMVGLPLTFPLLLKFLVMAHADSLLSPVLIVP